MIESETALETMRHCWKKEEEHRVYTIIFTYEIATINGTQYFWKVLAAGPTVSLCSGNMKEPYQSICLATFDIEHVREETIAEIATRLIEEAES